MSDCEKYEELCSAYLDEELNAEQQAELQAHLAVCLDCEAYLHMLQKIQTDMKTEQVIIPENLHESIMHAVVEEARGTVIQTEKPHHRPPVFTMLAAAAAVVMLVLTGEVGDIISTGRDMLGVDGAKTVSDANVMQWSAPNEAPSAEMAPFMAQADAADAGMQTPAEGHTEANTPQNNEAAPEKQEQPQKKQETRAPSAQTEAVLPSGGKQSGKQPDAAAPAQGALTEKVSPRMAIAMAPSLPDTPSSLQNLSFAFCYVVSGKGEIPSIAATYLDKSANGRVAYYAIKNDMSVLEKALADLSKSGFEPEYYDTVSGVLIDSKADSGLIIVIDED